MICAYLYEMVSSGKMFSCSALQNEIGGAGPQSINVQVIKRR